MNFLEPEKPIEQKDSNHIENFKRDGFVVIENALPVERVKKLGIIFLKLMDQKIKNSKILLALQKDQRQTRNDAVKIDFRPEGGNHDFNRWNMHVPSTSDFLNDSILSHSKVLSVIKAVMDDKPVAFLIASDTPYPGSGFQNTHQDFPRFGITVNIPLVDFTEENAPLEVWPTSHIRGHEFNTQEVNYSGNDIHQLVQRVPGQRLLVKAGSIVIRDQRLVHRGTANIGSQARPCLSIWFKSIESFSLLGLTIPTPNRDIANICARLGLKVRTFAKGGSDSIKNRSLLNWGNFYGRIVEECSASDRDFRRIIPKDVWNGLSAESKSLLRFASVEGKRPAAATFIGTALLVFSAVAFLFVSLILFIKPVFVRS